MAAEILNEFESHKPLVEYGAKVDLIFAYGERDDDTGELKGDALTHNGVKALGIAKKCSTKERAMGRGDAEVCLDADYWTGVATPEMQRALLDHELHHISLKVKKGQVVHDDLGRPEIKLRKHDVEIGWFGLIAERHGKNSQEQIQAKTIMDAYGQFYWPALAASTATAVAKRK